MSGDADPYELKRPHALIDWAEGGPVARVAGDVYFSKEDGLAETRSVFLDAAGFPRRFRADGATVVAELGFGTGLNFLALWDLFRRTAPEAARLHFVSVEGFPLHLADARRALSAFPELEALSAPLLAAWPSPLKGPHRRIFDQGRVTLTVFHDLADAALPQMDFAADAWFLDGFAPAKNPDMWSQDLFDQIGRLARPGAPAVTFTVAGAVRRGLATAGFTVEKKPGFGRKRERLEAIYAGKPPAPAATPFIAPLPVAGPVAIIGGGVAAANLAGALTRRGLPFEVFADGGWAAGASSAPLGLLTPRLEAADRPHNRALLAAFDFARAFYEGLDGFEPTGVARLADEARSAERLQRLSDLLDDGFEWMAPDQAQARCGLGGALGGMWMARAGQVRPARLVAALAGEAPARDVRITGVEHTGEGWRLASARGPLPGAYAAVIVAGGWDANRLLDAAKLPLEASAGRVGVYDSERTLPGPAAWGGYAAPLDGRVLIGATHVKGDDPGEADEADAALAALASAAPGGEMTLGPRVSDWGGVRAATPDRLPVVGALPGPDFAAVWARAARGGPPPAEGADPALAGPLVLGAFGARGFAHAPLLAEHLVSALAGEPLALERGGAEVLHPARLLWRRLRRGG